MFLPVPQGFSFQKSPCLLPPTCHYKDNGHSSRVHNPVSSFFQLTGKKLAGASGVCIASLGQSSGDQLMAALMTTRLLPPLLHFNASFYAGIWGCVCLQAICNEKKDQPTVELGGEGPRTAGKMGPFTEPAPGSGDRAAPLGCLRYHLISC